MINMNLVRFIHKTVVNYVFIETKTIGEFVDDNTIAIFCSAPDGNFGIFGKTIFLLFILFLLIQIIKLIVLFRPC